MSCEQNRDSLRRLLRPSELALVIALASVPAIAAHKVPDGFVVELAAAEPQVRFPMFACVGDKGRLFVAESSGFDLYKEISAGTRKCQVRLLEDRDGDGKYESAKVFADKLIFPMGLVWRAGKLYVADPPDLITVEDVDGDGIGDKRKVILTGFGAKDNGSLHGLTFGRDGLLYMTTGEPDGYRFNLPDGKVLQGVSGALIRCRPDGSNVEVLSRGFENLVEVIFMPGGEVIGTDNWYQHPQGGIRDALLHLVDGGLYPMKEDIGTPQPVTGDLLPPLSLFPAVALSGLERYEGRQFPREWHGNLFSAQHNSRKIGRHVLHRHDSTFRSEDSDFLVSDDPDFHPSDVLEDMDGSLLVLDTGAWYTQHCPTGRIRKSPATGGIYRVRYSGGGQRERARDETKTIWSMGMGELDTNALARALTSSMTDVICAAARVVALRGLRGFTPELVKLIAINNPPVQLAATEALARCGDRSAVPALVQALDDASDSFLEHATVHALHQVSDESALIELLSHQSPRVQRAALLLLSQSPRRPAALAPEMVLSRLQSTDARLRATAIKLLQSRPAWTEQALKVTKEWLSDSATLSAEQQLGLRGLFGGFFGSEKFQGAAREALENGTPAVRSFVLETLAEQPRPKDSQRWASTMRKLLSTGSPDLRERAARLAAAWQVSGLEEALQKLAGDPSQPRQVRLESVRAYVTARPALSSDVLRFLLAELRSERSLAAGELIRKAHLTDSQLLEALNATRNNVVVPPASLLVAFRTSSSEQKTKELLDTVGTLPPAGWSEEEYSGFVKRLPASLRQHAESLRSLFQPDAESQHARMAQYEPFLEGGDAERGRAVFMNAKVQCATCHAIGPLGGNVGPDLTRVGAIRSGRDLLESIVFPSSTFAQGYEPFIAETPSGEQHSGFIVRENETRIVLRTAAGNEVTLSRSEVRELRRADLSIMPEGLDTAMSREEFRDLLAFLQSLR